MDDGRGPNKKDSPRKPTWTERAVPETYRPGPTRPLSADEDALVPAADPIVQAAYKRNKTLPVRPVMNRGDGGTDALVIQRGAKQTRVLNFEVEGIHWRAGFAPEIGQTPLSQYVQSLLPPTQEVLSGNGFVLRPVEPGLEAVLRDITPGKLLALEEGMFGRLRELGGMYLYFVPQPTGASVGIIAWYTASPSAKAHLLYLQTEIKKADTRILDEMLKTFRASLAARDAQGGEPLKAMDLWSELQLATTQLEATLRSSSLARNSAEVRGLVAAAAQQAEHGLDTGLRGGMNAIGRFLHFLGVVLPQALLAIIVRGGTQALIAVIRGVDAAASRKPRGPGDPES